MGSLKSDEEEVAEETGIKIITSNKQICSYLVAKIRRKKLKQTYCSSEPVYLFHLEKDNSAKTINVK